MGQIDDNSYIFLTGMSDRMQGTSAVGKQDDNSRGSTAMPPQAVDAVGRKLKASYDRMLREPIPDKLIQLLEDLENSQENRKSSARAASDKSDVPDTGAQGEE